jgi:aminobenzoyl-glutamate utilization protein B
MRAPKVDQVQEIYERICNIARGAALMSGTECEIVFEKACSNYIPNMTIEKLLYANLLDVGIQQYDEVERLFAKKIKATLSEEDINNDLNMAQQFMGGKKQEILDELKEKDLPDVILPYTHASALLPGSSDVGDVSWVVPTAQLAIACSVLGTPMHSWQMVAQGNTSIAHKGMITAGKVMARSVVDLLLAPNKVIEAKMELKKTLDGKKYVSPIPPEVEPNIN